MGPVAEALARAGAPVERVFARAAAPIGLIENPDRIIALRDMFMLVEHAARELGDETMPVWLSAGAGVAWLGAYGAHLQSAATLREAIGMANTLIARGLQTATEMRLEETRPVARWTYRVTDTAMFGRQRNELLAFGYMCDLVRNFAGRNWRPDHVVVPGRVAARAEVERALGADIRGGEIACVALPAELLDLPNPTRKAPMDFAPMPGEGDFVGVVAELARTSLLIERRARIDWVADRLRLSTRSLQRRLADEGASFLDIRNAAVRAQACVLLARGARATDVAYELGYADPAHFTRAFTNWTGLTPSAYRRASGSAVRAP